MANASMQNVLRHIRALAGEQSAADADDGQLLERFAARQEPAACNRLLARQLGWPIGTVRSRRARARDRLRKRLTCRSLTLAAGPFTVVLAANTAGAALPAVLARTSLAAALRIVAGQAIAGTVSAHVVTLLDAASKSLSAMKLKTAAILVAGLCVLGAGAGVVDHQSTPAQPRAAAPPLAVGLNTRPGRCSIS